MRLPVNQALALAALLFSTGCASDSDIRTASAPLPGRTGPAADYPMVLGERFTIDGVTYTPADTLNYDAVGYARVGEGSGAGVTGAHKTLPLPSYVEVTSLASGRTTLVRLEERGPMVTDTLIELSPGAAAQLGIPASERAPVRVRRVNPPEQERALLRAGRTAPERMETPKPLLDVLMRKLREEQSQRTAAVAASPAGASGPRPAPALVATPARGPEDPPKQTPQHKGEQLVVQVAAFSTEARAEKAAAALGAHVSKPGQYWLMRLGPFASRAEAESALEKARAAGYSDARIQRAD